MARYIDADAIDYDFYWNTKGYSIQECQRAEQLVNAQPTADVVPKEKYDRLLENAMALAVADVRENVHGNWELAEDGWFCTSCEMYAPFDCDPEEKGIPFCPWCGADMRGKKDD